MGGRNIVGAVAVVTAMGIAGCSGAPAPARHPAPRAGRSRPASPARPLRLGAPDCHPASPLSAAPFGGQGSFGRQAEGTDHGAQLWALLFFAGAPHVGREVKIAWRMTGAGTFHLTAMGPGNRRLSPAWGPEAHGGSNWDEPGSEWGTGFVFTTAGCWDLHAARDRATADVWLRVAS